jgi:hypothetical protein
MTANQKTMVNTFWECNRKYFNHSLPTPIFKTFNRVDSIAKFECYKNKNKGTIYMSG